MLALSSIACSSSDAPPDPDKLSMVLKEPNVVVLDVRSDAEYARGHVPGAIHLPVGQILNAPSVLKDKKAPIVVHCAAGARSVQAVRSLASQGYTRLIDAQSTQAVASAMGVKLEK